MMFVVLVDLIELRTAERWVSGYACGRLMWKACLNCGRGHSLTRILDRNPRKGALSTYANVAQLLTGPQDHLLLP